MRRLASNERLLRAIRHQEVDRVPVSPRYFDYLFGVEGCECVHHCLWMARQFEHDLMPIYQPVQNNYLLHHAGPYSDLPGVSVSIDIGRIDGRLAVQRRFRTPAGELGDRRYINEPGSVAMFDLVIEPLVKDRADLDRVHFLLPPPEAAFMGEIQLLQEAVGKKGILLVSATQGVGQFLVDALGVERALLMYYDDRPLLIGLLRLFQDYHRAVLRRVLERGVEVVFESWYNCSLSAGWSPRHFEELFLPLLKQNVDLIHSYGVYVDYFDDGRMGPLLEDLADAGVDIVETLAPPPLGDVDLADAKRRVGSRVCLKGHVDPVNVVCRGTPAQIRQAVRRAVEIGGEGSGFILGTADSIRPESPPENIRAYFEAALTG